MYAAKLSILLQIKQIFEGTRQRKTVIFWASWTVIILVSSAYIATLMVLIFSCTPVRKVCALTTNISNILTHDLGLGSVAPRQMPRFSCRLCLQCRQSDQRHCSSTAACSRGGKTADGYAQKNRCLRSVCNRIDVRDHSTS